MNHIDQQRIFAKDGNYSVLQAKIKEALSFVVIDFESDYAQNEDRQVRKEGVIVRRLEAPVFYPQRQKQASPYIAIAYWTGKPGNNSG